MDIMLIEKAMKAQTDHLAEYRVDIPEGESGIWAVRKFTIDMNITILRHMFDGRATGIGEFTALRRNGQVIMSDTNAEIHDLLEHIDDLRGHVLVTGLGLGMTVQALLKRDSVKSITVIEQSKDVLNLCAGRFKKEKRVRIINADAYTWEPDRKFDSAWHDIWDDISSDRKPEWRRMKQQYRGAVPAGQQFCWGQSTLARRRA